MKARRRCARIDDHPAHAWTRPPSPYLWIERTFRCDGTPRIEGGHHSTPWTCLAPGCDEPAVERHHCVKHGRQVA